LSLRRSSTYIRFCNGKCHYIVWGEFAAIKMQKFQVFWYKTNSANYNSALVIRQHEGKGTRGHAGKGRQGKMAQARSPANIKDLISDLVLTVTVFVFCIYYVCNYVLTYTGMISITRCIKVLRCPWRDQKKTEEGRKSRPVM